MKVFLSHSTKDKEFVKKLASELQKIEIDPWLCEVDVLPGEDFVAEIEKGLKESDLTVLVWSPEAAKSAWTGEEWRSVLARQVEESRIRLVIVLLRMAEFPELLRKRHYIDAQTDHEAAIKQTVDLLIRQRDMRRFEDIQAASFILDFEPTDFVGRTEYLERLHQALVEKKGKFLLHGEPGCGKSMLALKFAWRVQGAFDAVVFQHCGQRSVEEIGVELADRLGLDVKELPPEKQIAEVNKWIANRQTLLVLDDIWNLDVKKLIPAPPLSVRSLALLCTSRQRRLPWVKPPRTLEVKSFAEEEAESLFRIYLGEEITDLHRDSLLELAKKFERLPIAVAVAADMLSQQFDPMDEASRVLELERLRNEIHDVPELMQHAVDCQPEREQKLLQAMAICNADGFWFPLTGQIASLDESDNKEARDRLVNASLVRLVNQGRQKFRLHALLRDQLLRSAPVEKLRGKHVAAVEELFEEWKNRWWECRECLTEVIPAIQFLWNGGESDRMERLSYWGFATAQRIGELNIALRIMKNVEDFFNDREDRDAKDGLQTTYGNQAVILSKWGRLEEAMELHKKQEVLCLELGNKDGLQATYGNQAVILRDWGRLEEAIELHKKQEALCLELGNKDGLQTTYGNQAVILRDWGRLEEAMELLKKQEALCLEPGNKDGLRTTYGNQALILRDWGRLEEAMELHKKKEALCLELGSKDGLQRSYGNQALILRDWGRLEEAMELHKKQEALCLELGNKDGLGATYGNQAAILFNWGRLEDAMELLKKQEALCLELGSKNGLGYCYWSWGLLAREMHDSEGEHEKLQAALQIFTKLNMPREKESVQAEIDKI
jgi:tetratricopeptide (TPR) repeat protein